MTPLPGCCHAVMVFHSLTAVAPEEIHSAAPTRASAAGKVMGEHRHQCWESSAGDGGTAVCPTLFALTAGGTAQCSQTPGMCGSRHRALRKGINGTATCRLQQQGRSKAFPVRMLASTCPVKLLQRKGWEGSSKAEAAARTEQSMVMYLDRIYLAKIQKKGNKSLTCRIPARRFSQACLSVN